MSWLQVISPTMTSPLRMRGSIREAVPHIRTSRGRKRSTKRVAIIAALVLPMPVTATTTRRPSMRPSA